MNEILRHYVPQNAIGQEPVIASEAKQSPRHLRGDYHVTSVLAMTRTGRVPRVDKTGKG